MAEELAEFEIQENDVEESNAEKRNSKVRCWVGTWNNPSMSDEEFENNFELFKTKATERYVNDEYYIQQLHEQMDDCLRDVIQEYLENKEEFIENNKIKDYDVEKEIYEEVENAYKTIIRYNKSKEIIQELSSKDNSCPDWLSNIFK